MSATPAPSERPSPGTPPRPGTPAKPAGSPKPGTPAKAAAPAAAGKAAAAPGGPPRPVAFPPEPIRAECEKIVARYPTRQAALLPILHLAQSHFGGWVSPEVEAGVAKWLGLSDAHVRGVLTFYAMFRTEPTGRHTVWVCRTLTCWLLGAKALTEAACRKAGVDRPGQSGKDGRFFVREMECLGLCEVAPAAWIDGAVHGKVTPEGLAALMDACP